MSEQNHYEVEQRAKQQPQVPHSTLEAVQLEKQRARLPWGDSLVAQILAAVVIIAIIAFVVTQVL